MPTDSTFVLYDSNLGAIVRGMQQVGLSASLTSIPVRFNVTMPAAIRARFAGNVVLNGDVQMKLANAIRAVVQRDLFPSITDNTRADAALRARVERVMRNATPGLTEIVVDTIKASMRTSAAWKDYKTDSSKEIARISLTLAAAGISAAIAPPTAGVSIGLLVVTLVRGLGDASKKFSESYRTAEESRARIIAEIGRLDKSYQRGKTAGRASQIGGAAAHALTLGKLATIFSSDPFPGFTRIKTEMNAYKGKLGHLNDRAEKLGWQLCKLLDTIDAYRAEHGLVTGNEAGHPELLNLQRKVSMLLTGGISGKRHGFRGSMTISDAWTRCQNGMTQLRDVERALSDLKALENRGNAVLITDRIVTLLLNLGVALAGYNAPLAAAGGTGAEIQSALRINPASATGDSGAGALGLGFFRQFMSLFKDTHALAKELGIVTASPDGSGALLDRVDGGFDRVPPDPQPARDLVRTLEARYAGQTAATPPAPTRAPPPVPTSS